MKDIYKDLSDFARVDLDVPLSTMTTLRIGGRAHYVVYPENTIALDAIMSIINEYKIPYKMIGKGSNLLCSDRYYDGVIIKLDYFDDYYFKDDTVVAQAGCSIIVLAYEAMKNGFSGLEFASGIPASVGGVTYMNAGAYKSSMSEIIKRVYVYRDQKCEWITAKECEFGYRKSVFHKHSDWVILAVELKLIKSDTEEIRALMESRRERRMSSQPLDHPSAGSVFRNPEEAPAWKLIEGIGYRGRQIGGAKVSDKHVNFIINAGGATAEDFMALVNEIKQKVKSEYSVELHMEVERFNW